MNTIIPRKVYEPGGFAYLFTDGQCNPLPPNVACLSSCAGRFTEITWDEVMARRRKEQSVRLERVRAFAEPQVCPCYVWTFFNRQAIPYHGWYCYVVARYFSIGVNFRGFKNDLAQSIMAAFPMGMLPLEENFRAWMVEFTKAFPRAKHAGDPRKSGSRIGWISDRRIFSLKRPQP